MKRVKVLLILSNVVTLYLPLYINPIPLSIRIRSI